MRHTMLYDIQVVLNKVVVEHANDVRRKSLLLKFPKDRVKKRRRQGDEELDYLEKRTKSANRRRTNPEVGRISESCDLCDYGRTHFLSGSVFCCIREDTAKADNNT